MAVVPVLTTERALKAGEQGVSSLWVPGWVGFAFFAITAYLPFPGRGVELSGVLDVHNVLALMTRRY